MPPVTIQLDLCFNLLPIPLCAPHNYIPCPPFPPVPPPMPGAVGACQALEIPVPAWWPPEFALGGAEVNGDAPVQYAAPPSLYAELQKGKGAS